MGSGVGVAVGAGLGVGVGAGVGSGVGVAVVYRRKLKLKANFETSFSLYSFKRLVPVAFNVNLTGSICTALPCARAWTLA